ncbi:Fic family protein [Nocardiopsis sp. NPDC006832]|uniref:Fic/DOC family protein n=1 Tax=Nocardiopsis sp. NPDC006832 TaxID=3157188 RepID=UPI0033C1E88F
MLRNQLGLNSHERLDEAMNDYATLEWAAMSLEPMPRNFDFAYLASIHHKLLGDVVGDDVVGHWAGRIRRNAAPMGALNTGIVYAREEYIQPGLDDVFGQLHRQRYLTGLDRKQFFGELSESWGYLTQIHPFRDGNTRSQTAFVDRLAVNAGYPIDWMSIDVDVLRELRFRAIADSTSLASYLEQRAIDTPDPYRQATASASALSVITGIEQPP